MKMPSQIALTFSLIFSLHAHSGTTAETQNLENFLFPNPPVQNAAVTETILVSKNGQLIYEKSKPGFTSDKPHILWSVTKSVSSLVVGAAVESRLVDVEESVCQIAPQYKDKIDCRMKLSDILEWSSGLNFLEVYEGNADRTQSSVGQMLYGDGHKDNVSFILGHKQIHDPGKYFYYSSGDSGLTLGLLKYRLPLEKYKKFPDQKLFEPLGIQSAVFETDLQGHYMSGTSLYMTSHDLLKIGLLVLQQGLHNGQRLVPAKWISYLTTTLPHFQGSQSDPLWIPCRQWWRPNLKNMGLENHPHVPADIYVARGHWGQYLVVIPSMKLVAVRFGLDQKKNLDESRFIKHLIDLGAE